MIKFDYIIQNPPYSGSLHLEFLKEGLEMLKKEGGKMTIIEPATWLINVRKNGKAKLYSEIKELLKNHVSKVIIENLNEEFNTENTSVLSIIYIDFSKSFDFIKYICCGEFQVVKSLNDCNLIGDKKLILSIFNKIYNFDTIKNHITNTQFDKENIFYLPISDIVCPVTGLYFQRSKLALSDTMYFKHKYGEYFQCFIAPTLHISRNEISNIIHKKAARGGSTTGKVKLTDNPANCVYGTLEEIKNYKHYITNNSLPLFLNICLTTDQHNNSINYVPWLVDKKYTDEEINTLFNFTPEEISLIDKTLKKFERYSPWFKRYMCGKGPTSSEES